MIPKPSPEVSGPIRARLDALRNRKAILDELIPCMERYAAFCVPASERSPTLRTLRPLESPTRLQESTTRSKHKEGAQESRLAGAA